MSDRSFYTHYANTFLVTRFFPTLLFVLCSNTHTHELHQLFYLLYILCYFYVYIYLYLCIYETQIHRHLCMYAIIVSKLSRNYIPLKLYHKQLPAPHQLSTLQTHNSNCKLNSYPLKLSIPQA